MRFRTVRVSWKTRDERSAMLMLSAPGSLKYLLYGNVAFLILTVASVIFIERLPKGDSRLLIGVPMLAIMFGTLFYSLHLSEQHTWNEVKKDSNGIPVFFSFGEGDTMLLGTQKGWVGYGCLKSSSPGRFSIASKYDLAFQLDESCVQFGSVLIESRAQSVACFTSEDGKQLFLWLPRRDIRTVLESLLRAEPDAQAVIHGIPDILSWPVLGPTRFTTKGLWPTLGVVCLLQGAMVYLAKLAQMPGVEWVPTGLAVAPMIYVLFEGTGRQRTMPFEEFLKRQVVAHDPERLA